MSKKSNLSFHCKINDGLPLEYEQLYIWERKILQEIIRKNDYVCDVWAGWWRTIDDIYTITSNIIGIDYDQDAINWLCEKYPELAFTLADAVNLPFSEKIFDVVTCMMSWLNFWDKKEKSLEEMYRVLKDNWILIISTFHENALPIRLKVYQDIWIKIKEILWWKVVFDEEFWANTSEQFTKNELHQYLSTVGFVVEEIFKVWVGYICICKK